MFPVNVQVNQFRAFTKGIKKQRDRRLCQLQALLQGLGPLQSDLFIGIESKFDPAELENNLSVSGSLPQKPFPPSYSTLRCRH